MLGETLVRLVKVGLVVGMDDATLAAAVDGVVFGAFAKMIREMPEDEVEEPDDEEKPEEDDIPF